MHEAPHLYHDIDSSEAINSYELESESLYDLAEKCLVAAKSKRLAGQKDFVK